LPDANRPKPAPGRAANAPPKSPPAKPLPKAPARMPSRPAESEPVDPRIALAQQYMKSAAASEAEKEAAQPRSRRTQSAGSRPTAFAFSIAPATFVHVLLSVVTATFCACAWLWAAMLMMNYMTFDAGRIIAMPAGFVTAATLGYLSICYLGVIESTSAGRTEVDVLHGDWRDWFWTLPMTLGMASVAAGVGWLLSLVLPVNVWLLIAFCLVVLYPVLQLSALETGSPLAPLSVVVVRSMFNHPFAWLVLYGGSFAVIQALLLVYRLAWVDPPFVTILLLGPLVTVALFFYAWLLGQLANLISTGK
jgi:hypothetical protein